MPTLIQAFLEEYADLFNAFKQKYEAMTNEKKQAKKDWLVQIQQIQQKYTRFYKQLPQPPSIELPDLQVIRMNELMFQSYSIHFMEVFLKEHSIQPITFKEANHIDPSVDISGWAYNPNRYHDHWVAMVHQLQQDPIVFEAFQKRYGTQPLYTDSLFNRRAFITWFVHYFYKALRHSHPTV